jgi:hypothetical protein
MRECVGLSGKLTAALTDCAVAVSVGTEAEAATKAAITNEVSAFHTQGKSQ